MNDYFATTRAVLRAVFSSALTDSPDRRAMESIERLDAALDQRSHNLAQSAQRLAREL